jgi:uncharacterized protein
MNGPSPACGPTHYLSSKLELRETSHKGGWGVFARELVFRGEVVAMWGGRVISEAEAMSYDEDWLRYIVQVEDRLFMAPSVPPEPAEFINHSCDPSAGLSGQISLVALRDIEPGEEVCYDYAMSDSHRRVEFECHCGSPLCRGRFSADDWRSLELQMRYAGHFSPYLQRRIDASRRNDSHVAEAMIVQDTARRVPRLRARARSR